MCCSGHGKNGALCVLRQSIRPEMITEVCLYPKKFLVYEKNGKCPFGLNPYSHYYGMDRILCRTHEFVVSSEQNVVLEQSCGFISFTITIHHWSIYLFSNDLEKKSENYYGRSVS